MHAHIPILSALLLGLAACDPSPYSLEETGLYEDISTETIASDVMRFEPNFPLWSEGKQIRRWVSIPDSAQIDTTDMDTWLFPEGVRFWKELSRNGVKIETRFLWKVGPESDDWAYATYLWDETQTHATRAYFFGMDRGRREHTTLSRADCLDCHRTQAIRPLGFSAVQLEHDPDDDQGLSLDDLIEANLLSHPPEEPIELPGDTLSQAALGYLHGNCGCCHSSANRALSPEFDLLLDLRIEDLSAVETTLAHRTAVNALVHHGTIDGKDRVILPGEPDDSVLLLRIARRDGDQMPPFSTDTVDDEHVALLHDWIAALEDPLED